MTRSAALRLFLLSPALFLFLSLQAQTISGRVVDEKKHGVSGVSILLLKQSDSSLVKSSLSDKEGIFMFREVPAAKYILEITLVSHKRVFVQAEVTGKDLAMEPIVLSPDATLLKEVKVISSKPFLEQKADKLIVNVEASATMAGATALEILQKVPGVLVRNDQVTMVGKGTPAILIDGRISQYTDISQLLRDLSAANIEKIEVISNPGARYDASGGAVINIILKKNANLGTNGSVYFITGSGLYDRAAIHADRGFYRFNPGFNINHRKGKLNVFGGFGFFHRNWFNYHEFDRIISPNRFFQEIYEPNKLSSYNFRLGADLYSSKKNTFGFYAKAGFQDKTSEASGVTHQLDAITNQALSQFNTQNNTYSNRNSFSANLNWKHMFDSLGQDLNIDLDYATFRLTDNGDILTTLTNNSSYTTNQFIKNPVQYLVWKADYTDPINQNLKLEAGAKTSFATINNNLLFLQRGIPDANKSTDFKYTERISALYSSLTWEKNKWEFQGGLRTEQTIAKGTSQSQTVLKRNYWQLFPSAFVLRKMGKKMAGILQYSRRVKRPSYQQQNPFIEYLDSLTYTRGNPLIRPETMDAYKFSLTYEQQPFFAISYNKKHDVIIDDAPKQDGNLTYTTAENLAAYENISVELNFPLNFGKKFTGYGGNQAIYNHYKADYLGGRFDRSRWNWLAYIDFTYKPNDSWNFQLSGYYMTKSLQEFITIRHLGSLDLGIAKTFWNKKGRLTLNISDIFFGERSVGFLEYQEINVKFLELEDSRNVRLAFRYSFGNQKLKAERKRNTASDAEEERVKGN